ncbi:hypothetical protein LCGC14_0372580 [marine sediment metagenome]|uniref:Uncharacterized protein n=1 Tax=marine sediment metagenome TaxID=412755 RepID=A0A0F9TMR9_9ZZZZ
MCPICNMRRDDWPKMRLHIKVNHPEIKRPDKLFTKEARKK